MEKLKNSTIVNNNNNVKYYQCTICMMCTTDRKWNCNFMKDTLFTHTLDINKIILNPYTKRGTYISKIMKYTLEKKVCVEELLKVDEKTMIEKKTKWIDELMEEDYEVCVDNTNQYREYIHFKKLIPEEEKKLLQNEWIMYREKKITLDEFFRLRYEDDQNDNDIYISNERINKKQKIID